MSLTAGTRFGPYEVLGILGSGGMGEVYRVRDTRLDRVVAMKVLPEHQSDPSRRERFQREARAVAALNHPHICTIHDVGHQAGIDYLVMELIDGESLATRLRRGPLSLDLALALAIEIADGLSRAHRQGIVHRDLKPGNVMLTKTGSGRPHATHAKLLDFGLASMVRPDALGPSLSALPTETAPLTEPGAVLGTLQYMAPEQLEGRPTDQRADIFAFGTLLFEMVTGRRAFEGSTSASVMAGILRQDAPSIRATVPSAPEALDRLVHTCLEKDPDDRFASMHDVLLQLRWIATGPTLESGAPAPSAAGWVFQWRHALIAAAVVVGVAGAGFWWGRMTSVAEPSPGGQPILNILPFEQTASWTGAALSPDGQTLVAVAAPRQPEPAFLWIRRLASPAAQRLEGSDGALYPFWSPDGREVGFFTRGNKLKRLDIATPGSVPLEVCDVTLGRGGAWFDDGTIIFADAAGQGLKRVLASGGSPSVFLPLDDSLGFSRFSYPVRVGARQVLFLAVAADASHSELRLANLDVPGKSVSIVLSSKSAAYANGFLFFDRHGVAVAQRLDTNTGTLTGEFVVVTGYVQGNGNVAYRHFLAGGRTVVWWNDRPALSQLTWVDRSGTVLGPLGPAARYNPNRPLALSPDDRRLAVSLSVKDDADIWSVDTKSGARQPLTDHPSDDIMPLWSPDGTRVAFISLRGMGGNQNLYSVSLAQPGKVETHAEAPLLLNPVGWTPSGELVWFQGSGFQSVTEKLSGPAWFNLRGVIMAAPGLEPRLVNADPIDGQVKLSPDGTALAYSRTLAGELQICLDSFPAGQGCRALPWSSTARLSDLLWRADGRELIFKAGDDVMAVRVQTGPTITFGKPERLFQSRGTSGLAVTRDGSRFLVGVRMTDALSTITVIPNWVPDRSK